LGDGNLDSLPTTKHRIIQLKSIDSEEHMAEVYRTGNLFVTAAIEDNYPNTIIESLSCGTPVVGYSATGIVEMVKANFGITADPNTVNSLAHVIRQGLETQWDKARIAKEAHALWNVELQADRYLAEYKKLLASS
jgi:glycosyltransferase involved in cell wall biosynthesis